MNQVTVIIPAYNAERTIGKTIDGLKAQTIPIDIIVVDDGSRVPLKLNDVRVIRQENSGAYTARLRGVKEAHTKYIGFVDADDTVEPNMFERLVSFAEQYNLDIAQCDLNNSANVGLPPDLFLGRESVTKNLVMPRLVRGEGAMTVWSCLYRAETFFPKGKKFRSSNILMFDDLAINCQVIEGVERYGRLHEGLYHYNVNDGSSVRNFKPKNVEDLREALVFRSELLTHYGIPIDGEINRAWIRKNVRNMFIVAASAKCESWKQRMKNIHALYEVLEENGGKRPNLLKMRTVFQLIARRVMRMLRGC